MLSNTRRPVFGSWLGWRVAAGTPIVFVLDPGQDRAELVRQCLDVGHEHLLGELGGGIDAWASAGGPLRTIEVVNVDGLTDTIIDVRRAAEFATGRLPAARNIELGAVPGAAAPTGR